MSFDETAGKYCENYSTHEHTMRVNCREGFDRWYTYYQRLNTQVV